MWNCAHLHFVPRVFYDLLLGAAGCAAAKDFGVTFDFDVFDKLFTCECVKTFPQPMEMDCTMMWNVACVSLIPVCLLLYLLLPTHSDAVSFQAGQLLLNDYVLVHLDQAQDKLQLLM